MSAALGLALPEPSEESGESCRRAEPPAADGGDACGEPRGDSEFLHQRSDVPANSPYADALLARDGFIFQPSRECFQNASPLAVIFFSNRNSRWRPRFRFRPLHFEVTDERVDDALVSDQQARGAIRPERDQCRMPVDDEQLCRQLLLSDANLFSVKKTRGRNGRLLAQEVLVHEQAVAAATSKQRGLWGM